MRSSGWAVVVALIACGGRPAPATSTPGTPSAPGPSASTSSSAGGDAGGPREPQAKGTVVERAKLKGGEHGTAFAELECEWERSSQKQPKAKKVHAPILRAELAWRLEADRSFLIELKKVTMKPSKVDKEFVTLSNLEGRPFEGRLDEIDEGHGKLLYGSPRAFTPDAMEIVEQFEAVIAYALVAHIPVRPVAEGEEWSYREKSDCGGPTCVDTTKSKLAPMRDGHLVMETVYRYETVEHEYGFAKVPVWWGETKVTREIVPGMLLDDIAVERSIQLELESSKAWRKNKTNCHAAVRRTKTW